MAGKKVRKLKMDAFPVLTVHDSVIWDTERAAVDDLIEINMIATDIRTDFHQQTWLKCPMKLDASVGPNWAELKELGKEPDYDKMIIDFLAREAA